MTMKTYTVPDLDPRGLAESAMNYLTRSDNGMPNRVEYNTRRFSCIGEIDACGDIHIHINKRKDVPVLPPGDYKATFSIAENKVVAQICEGSYKGFCILMRLPNEGERPDK